MDRPAASGPKADSPYAWYVLVIITAVYTQNWIARQLIVALAPDIQHDLNISNADIAFLYGSAFGIFYALFGIAQGRLADNWRRTWLMTAGLVTWSAMTLLSGFTNSFFGLTATRLGVGIGEATAAPTGLSLLSDWFSRRHRGLVFAFYSAGIYVGGGLAFVMGPKLQQLWQLHFANPAHTPLGLHGWQAVFVAAGLPGFILALLLLLMHEPIRGLADGLAPPPRRNPWPLFWQELSAVLPPITLIHHALLGGKALRQNLVLATGMAAGTMFLVWLTGNAAQWIAFGIGVYAIASWSQSLRQRDAPLYALTFGTPAFLYAMVAFGLIAFSGYAIGQGSVIYVRRAFPATNAVSIGLYLGLGSIAAGIIGTLLGGWVSDLLKYQSARGRIWVIAASVILPVAPLLLMFSTHDLATIYILNIVVTVTGTLYLGAAVATTQELVLPRMRGTAGAIYIVASTILGLALGPYYSGKITDLTLQSLLVMYRGMSAAQAKALPITAQIASLGTDLTAQAYRTGVLAVLAIAPITLFCLWQLYRRIGEAERTRAERAAQAGEVHL